jgi:hypothetical protein
MTELRNTLFSLFKEYPPIQEATYAVLGREHPFRDDGETGVGKNGGADSLGGADVQAPLERDLGLVAAPAKGPK